MRLVPLKTLKKPPRKTEAVADIEPCQKVSPLPFEMPTVKIVIGLLLIITLMSAISTTKVRLISLNYHVEFPL
jgi:hypothetical protein